MSQREHEPVTIALRSGEAAVFGYGSLLSRSSLERTLRRGYEGPFIPCSVRGWRRSWDAAMPNSEFYALRAGVRVVPEFILYLNVRPDAATSVNGVLFVVSAAQLAALDERESIYDRVPVGHLLEGAEVTGGEAYIYVTRPEHTLRGVTSPAHAAIRASYLSIVSAGLNGFDADFQRRYVATSDEVPAQLVIEDERRDRDGAVR
jgi:cation transport regulator ChaC